MKYRGLFWREWGNYDMYGKLLENVIIFNLTLLWKMIPLNMLTVVTVMMKQTHLMRSAVHVLRSSIVWMWTFLSYLKVYWNMEFTIFLPNVSLFFKKHFIPKHLSFYSQFALTKKRIKTGVNCLRERGQFTFLLKLLSEL